MTYTEAIGMLQGQILKLKSGTVHFDAWLNTTIEYIEKVFGGNSTPHKNFVSTRHEYKINRIGKNQEEVTRNYITIAIHQVEGLIQQLHEMEAEAIRKEAEEKNINEEQIIEKDDASEESGFKQFLQSFTKISAGAWATIITIFIAAVGGAYVFGKDNGYTKFDQEKIDLFDDNKTLRTINKNLSDTLFNTRDSLHLNRDTVSTQKKIINDYFLLLTPEQRDSIQPGPKG